MESWQPLLPEKRGSYSQGQSVALFTMLREVVAGASSSTVRHSLCQNRTLYLRRHVWKAVCCKLADVNVGRKKGNFSQRGSVALAPVLGEVAVGVCLKTMTNGPCQIRTLVSLLPLDILLKVSSDNYQQRRR